jgi:hypothetical protein
MSKFNKGEPLPRETWTRFPEPLTCNGAISFLMHADIDSKAKIYCNGAGGQITGYALSSDGSTVWLYS